MTDSVLPGETNPLNNLFGGELLARMDSAASISARRHSKQIVVTSSVNHVSFDKAIPVGSTVTIQAKVSRVFNSSMEVYIDVWIDDEKGEKIKANEAIYTFVAVNKNGKPIAVDKLQPESEEEKQRDLIKINKLFEFNKRAGIGGSYEYWNGTIGFDEL